jgi:hypothetical protein
MRNSLLAKCVATCLVVAGLVTAVLSYQPPGQPRPRGELFPGLIEGLKSSPGCLGVETAQTGSGKAVIFAWFEDKKAAVAWYNSELHLGLMKKFFPEAVVSDKPLRRIADDSGPIMAIASITPTGQQTKEHPLPIKQIAIELYQPLPGGLAEGGTFAPANLKLPAGKGSGK